MSDRIPAVGIGTYENTDPEVCAESVATALDAGYRHVDTAEMYGNEAAVGEGIARADVDREDVFVATKIDTENLAYDDALASAEGCLDRLGLDAVDLLYVHWPIRTYDPDDTLAAFDELYDRGVVRHVGLSNFRPDQLDEALDRLDAPLFAHQVECHPLLPQDYLRAHADEHGYRLVAYSPLAKGRVTEVPELVEIAEEHDATAAQVSLAWLLARDVAVIPKSSSPERIRENLAARNLTLGDDELARIDAIDRRERQVDFDAAPWN
ncbi:aldo/keto reductase [Halostella salina]|uniref:aldo/keto reductase n=1 Tax=Halostella salina TaxID=1547897 RepID=UPI000EF829B3|nr:aldo/keto reductase [Halostella salina]